MRFGSFSWPDFFTFEDGRAHCTDCESAAQKLELRGPFILNSASAESALPSVEGELVNKCGDHHFEMNEHQEGRPQHSVFRIGIGNRIIGETNPVPSMATGSIILHLTDKKLNEEFGIKQREMTDAFRRFWRI